MSSEAELGARIRAVRTQSGLAAQDLAARAGFTPYAWSNIERGVRNVKSSELLRIARALGVSPMALLDPESLLARLPIAARAIDGVAEQSSALDRITALAEISDLLRRADIPAQPDLDDIPAVDLNDWLGSAQMLSEWALGHLKPDAQPADATTPDPFLRLLQFIEGELRIDVLIEPHESDPLLGAAITDRSFPLIFVNATQPPVRLLFTLAHELGHVLANDGEAIAVDRNLSAHNDTERFANAFAAGVLMPEYAVSDWVSEHGLDPDSLANMLMRFGVSMQSLIYRLHNLRIINARTRDKLQATSFAGLLSQVENDNLRAWLATTRAATSPTKPPFHLAYRVLKGYKRGTLSIRPLAGLFGVDTDELLASVQQGEQQEPGSITPTPDCESSNEELYSGDPL
jgi:Zn-dependent peptidase ImmA (M78 family)